VTRSDGLDRQMAQTSEKLVVANFCRKTKTELANPNKMLLPSTKLSTYIPVMGKSQIKSQVQITNHLQK